MGKPVLALDLDDVLAEYASSFIEYESGLGVVIAPQQISRSFVEMGVPPVHFQIFESNGYLQVLQTEPGAREAVETLADSFELVIITSRNERTKPQTSEWVARFFPEIHRIIHSADKGATYREIGAIGMVEDQIRFAEMVEHPYVLAQPWNKEWQGIRGSWEELVPIILGATKKETVADESKE